MSELHFARSFQGNPMVMVNFDLVVDATDFVNATDHLCRNNEGLPEVEETP